jgi:hypothetical protein
MKRQKYKGFVMYMPPPQGECCSVLCTTRKFKLQWRLMRTANGRKEIRKEKKGVEAMAADGTGMHGIPT